MFKNTKERTRAVIYDEDNFRFVLDKPTNTDIVVDVPYVLRSISHGTNWSWKKIAEFIGLRSASDAFVAAYRSRPVRELAVLNEFLVIDDVENKVYFYDKNHKPAGVITEHIGPKIVNGISALTVRTKVPTKVLSRMTITAPDTMQITMTISPTGGYMFDEQDRRLAMPNTAWVVSSTAKTLNQILRSIYFIATEAGAGEIAVKVDDMSGALGGAMSTAVTLTIEESKEPSIPELVIPGEQQGVIGEYGTIDAVLVDDADNKFMQVKVQPFGCEVSGFKGRLDPVEPGSFHIIYGTPENLNNELSSLEVKPYQANASLGVELRCDLVVLREYIRITATEPAETDTTETNTESVVVAPEPVVTTEEKETTQTAKVTIAIKKTATSAKTSASTESTDTSTPTESESPASAAE